ncbi:MAG: carboxypeptidase-like regulatory domain-containing protein, partial [Bryobacteraceae bacterium]
MGALLLNCLLASCALAQIAGTTGVVQGSISDTSGSGIPAARVYVRNSDTSIQRVSQTDEAGNFVIPNVGIGFWRLAVEATGFTSAETEPFQVSVGQVVVHRLQLQPAGLVEKLEVREYPTAIEAQASTASVALGYERIEEAPARSRNYLNFVLAAPSVAPAAGSASQRTMTGVRSPVPDTGFTFAGVRPRNNSIQIDGMDNRDETTGGNRVAVGLEMVQEFRVSAILIGAELGGAAGGVLNMVTRSGVNLWHGDVTWFMQNEALNAKRSEVDDAMGPRFRRYQPGASAMGPLLRDRTFIAAAVEYEKEAADEFGNVPADALRSLSASPLSDQFNITRELYPTWSRGTESSVKLDHHAGSVDAFWSRYAFSRGRVLHEVQGALNFADRSAQGSSLTTDHSLVGSWMRVLSPSVANDVRVQIGQRSMNIEPNARGPMFEVPGFLTFGQFYDMDADRTERHYQVVQNLQFAFKRHRISAGADAHIVTLNAAMRNRYSGVYVFPTLEDLS